MADVIKYVSIDKLGYYDKKIKSYIDSADETLKSNLEGQVEVVAGALDKEIERAKAAEQANATAASNAQAAADNVATYVGTFTASEGVDTVVKYIDAKTANIASDETVNALGERVTQAEKDIDAIEADYLKAADAEALQGAIDGVAEDVSDITKDYLKAADKTELEGKIGAKADQTALDAEVTARETAVSGLQTQINTIMNNPDAEGAINSINEFTQYVADHGTIADGFRTDITKNKEDIAALDTAYKAADTEIKGRLDNLEAIDHNAYVAADTALKNELNTEIAKKANSADVTASVQTLEAADEELSGRLDDVEAALGTGEGSVSAQIGTAKQEAIDAAAADATAKANALETSLKAYVDAEDEKIETRVASLETASATHALASDLTALAGRVTTAEGEIDALQTDLDAAEVKIAANETAISGLNTTVGTKAAQSDLDNAVTRIATLETWHENFEECTEDDINSLFTV